MGNQKPSYKMAYPVPDPVWPSQRHSVDGKDHEDLGAVPTFSIKKRTDAYYLTTVSSQQGGSIRNFMKFTSIEDLIEAVADDLGLFNDVDYWESVTAIHAELRI